MKLTNHASHNKQLFALILLTAATLLSCTNQDESVPQNNFAVENNPPLDDLPWVRIKMPDGVFQIPSQFLSPHILHTQSETAASDKIEFTVFLPDLRGREREDLWVDPFELQNEMEVIRFTPNEGFDNPTVTATRVKSDNRFRRNEQFDGYGLFGFESSNRGTRIYIDNLQGAASTYISCYPEIINQSHPCDLGIIDPTNGYKYLLIFDSTQLENWQVMGPKVRKLFESWRVE